MLPSEMKDLPVSFYSYRDFLFINCTVLHRVAWVVFSCNTAVSPGSAIRALKLGGK